MENYAEEFIKQKVIYNEMKNLDGFETIVVRLSPKYFSMLKVLSENFDFSITSAFTGIISSHVRDMVLSLNEEDLCAFQKKFSHHDSLNYEGIIPGYGNTALWLLRKSNVIPEDEISF